MPAETNATPLLQAGDIVRHIEGDWHGVVLKQRTDNDQDVFWVFKIQAEYASLSKLEKKDYATDVPAEVTKIINAFRQIKTPTR